jgi:ATP-dependent helicase/nuclease subunit B
MRRSESAGLARQLSLLDAVDAGSVERRPANAELRPGSPELPRAQHEGLPMGAGSNGPVAGPLAPGRRPDDVPAPGPEARGFGLELFHAGSAEAEIEEVFRRVLAAGAPLDAVEIVCVSPTYSTLVWEKALRHDWPVTMAGGVPAALTRPGRALVALADWIADDFSAGLLRRLLQSGDVRLPDGLDLTAARAARLLIRAQAAWGRDTYRLSLGRLAASARRRAERDDLALDERDRLRQRAAQAEALAAWIVALVDGVPRPDAGGRIDLQALAATATTFVGEAAARASALDAAAATSLADAIRELEALGAFRCTLDQGLRFLRERVDRVAIGADRARPGHLHVSTLAQAGLADRRLVAVVGLEEGRVFPAPFEDPILLDAEREAIHPDLPRSTDRTDEAVYAALGRLAAISGRPGVRVTLSYSCRDTREFRPAYASWLMLQAYRVLRGEPRASYTQLHDALGAPVSCVPGTPDDALDASRWWLSGVTRAGARARHAVLRHYDALAGGVRADEARQSDRFTEYDGHVPDAGAALDPCASGVVVSPTQLEEAAACPFRFFLRRGLGVDAIESGERDRDAWLDPLIRGSLLHDLYATLLRRCRSEQRRASLAEDADWLLARGRDTLAALAREMPPPSAEIHDRESRAFLDDLRLFVRAEAEAPDGRDPIGFEVSFGRADGVDDEPLAQADPVVVDLGGGLAFRLAGRIDRIDRIGRSTFEIIDYKTGRYWERDWLGTFAGGRRLQHALYGLAARELLARQDARARVAGAHYYFSSARGHQERKTIAAPSRAALGAVLGDLRQVIASGLFVHARDMESACKWCDYGQACGRDAAARAGAKLADPALAPCVRLEGHE